VASRAGRTLGGLPQIDLRVDASTFLPVRLVGTKGTVTSAIEYTHRATPPAQAAQARPSN